MSRYSSDILKYISEEIECLNKIDINEIDRALNSLEEALVRGNKIFVFGNGGSASTASHFQNDFNYLNRGTNFKKFQFVCLNDNIPTIMAIANDIGYDAVFRYQIEGRMREGDIVIAISCSGNSKNVLEAVEYAKDNKNQVIGVTGFTGGRLKEMADISLHVPINNMQIAEDVHLMFNHLMMHILNKAIANLKED